MFYRPNCFFFLNQEAGREGEKVSDLGIVAPTWSPSTQEAEAGPRATSSGPGWTIGWGCRVQKGEQLWASPLAGCGISPPL